MSQLQEHTGLSLLNLGGLVNFYTDQIAAPNLRLLNFESLVNVETAVGFENVANLKFDE